MREAGIGFEVVPLPKEYAADCGLAIEFETANQEAVEKVIKRNRISIKGIYPYSG